MANRYNVANVKGWKRCTCCGLKIRHLKDHRGLAFLMGASSVKRRGFQCANCGEITCYECSVVECRCSCKSNAWIALPYLEPTERKPPKLLPTGV